MTVKYSLPTLMKRVMTRGGRLQWVTKVPLSEAISVLQRAAVEAYPPVDPDVATLDFSGPGGGDGGPVLYVNRCEAPWLGEHFITQLAQALERAGYSGQLRQAERVIEPQFVSPSVVLAAKLELDWPDFLAAGPNEAGFPVGAWLVARDRTRRVLEPWLDWTTSPTEYSYLMVDAVTSKVTAPLVKELVLGRLTAPRSSHRISLLSFDDTGQRARRLCLSSHGFVGLQSWDPAVSWEAHAVDLIGLATSKAEDLANGFLRNTHIPDSFQVWEAPSPSGWPLWGPAREAHLEGSYLQDVHGWQLVTSRHLDRLRHLDPDRWIVERVVSDRYIVAARDLRPWLDADPRPLSRQTMPRPPIPPTDVLELARNDFAEVLLTRQVLVDHPFPPMGPPPNQDDDVDI